MTPPPVSVIIPNLNGERWLAAALDSLLGQDDPRFEILLVDNASTDASVDLVERRYPRVRLLRLERNRGFAGGVNAGIRASEAPLVAVLNNDAVAEPGWMGALLAAAADHPDAGSFACKLLHHDRPEVVEAAGNRLDLAGRAIRIGEGERDGPAHAVARDVFGASGGAVLYRRSMLEQVGLFDEAFFAYYEDMDLAFRAQAAGWRCRYVPDAVVRHVGSATLRHREDRRSLLCLRNRLYFLIKCYPLVPAVRHLARLASSLGMEVRFCFAAVRARHGARRAASDLARVGAEVLLRSPVLLAQRLAIRCRRQVPAARLRALIESG